MPEDLSWTRPYGKDAVTVASDEEAGPCLCWPPRPWGGTGVGRHSAIRRNRLVIALVIGIPLGLRSRRRESTVGVAISLGLVFVFYLFIVLADALVNRPALRPDLIIWIPVLVGEAAGFYLLWRNN